MVVVFGVGVGIVWEGIDSGLGSCLTSSFGYGSMYLGGLLDVWSQDVMRTYV